MERRNQKMDVTQDEVSKLTKAMKDKEFKKYMDEYCKETSDPKNRKEYLQYLEQLEAKGEMPEGQALLRTQPGCCVKTNILFKSGQTQKCFINIVHSDQLDDFSMETEKDKGQRVHLPYSLSPPRPDRDHSDEYCMTCDLAVSSRTFFQATQRPQILKMLVDIASENLGKNFLNGFEEVKKDYKVMQRMQCKGGMPMPMSVKAELLKDGGKKLPAPKASSTDAVTPGELRQMRAEAKEKISKADAEEDAKAARAHQAKEEARRSQAKKEEAAAAAPKIRVPKHRLVHSGTLDLTDFMECDNLPSAPVSNVPRLLRLIVELPTVKKSSDVNLEVTSLNVVVEVFEKYYLDLPLPYEIDDENGAAKFDKAKQTLTLELPVVPKPPDPELIKAASRFTAAVTSVDEQDGALDENRGASSDEDLPPLEDEKVKEVLEKDPALTATTAPVAVDAPVEELAPRSSEHLEFGDTGTSALHIPAARAAAAAADIENGAQAEAPGIDPSDVHEGVTQVESYPEFMEADSFQGARPGYAFKMGDEGLGYYRDLRQPLPGKAASTQVRNQEIRIRASKGDDDPDPVSSSGPLVTEVASSSNAEAATSSHSVTFPKPNTPQLPPLSAALQTYVNETSRLRERVPRADCETGLVEELPTDKAVAWHQNRHNIVLLLGVSDGYEVADVQLVLLDRRLSITFCERPPQNRSDDASSLFQRYRLRRVLFGFVDARQWHVERFPDRGGQLAIVLRKVDQSESWPEAFDTAATTAWHESGSALPSAPPSALPVAEAALAEESAEASEADAHTFEASAASRPDASGDRAVSSRGTPSGRVTTLVDIGSAAEDSTALDAATPIVMEGPQGVADVDDDASAVAAAAAASSAAAAAAAASAAVMGQSVLLQTRLMYQLL